jgi:hypothetical protein
MAGPVKGVYVQLAESISIAPPKRFRVIKPPEKPGGSKLDTLAADLMAAYGSRDYHTAYRLMLETLQAIHEDERLPSTQREAETARAIAAILTVFVSPEIEIPESLAGQWLYFMPTIGNAASASGLGTTDGYIHALGAQRQRAFKSAILTTARNTGSLDVPALFRANRGLGSAWFCQVFKQAFSCNLNPAARSHLMTIGKTLPVDSLTWQRDIQEPYFTCSYFGDIAFERHVKSEINKAAKARGTALPKASKPRGRVAVVTDNWLPGHSVYRTIRGYVDAIKQDFEVVLVHAIRDSDALVTDGFAEVIRLPYDGNTLDLSPLDFAGFSAVLYPDVGMTPTSIELANMRLAPVQVMFTGHPCSTFGSEIDHFVSGEWTETAEHTANYSENLVRLPGFGAIHDKPTYQPKGNVKTTNKIVINASWYGQKITPMALKALNEAVAQSGRECLVRLFTGSAATNYGAFAAVIRDVGSMLPACETEIVPHLPYEKYMELLEQGDFAVDVFPYAGSNTVSDNLWLKKPVVCLEGDRWFNRIGPAMLRRIGIESPQDEQEYVDEVAAIIADDEYRQAMKSRIESADLDSAIYGNVGAEEFRSWLNATIKTA